MTVRTLNLVVPLAQKATAMRTTETAGSAPERSGAVSRPIGQGLRPGDVDSTTLPGIRTSTTATRTTTTPTTSSAPAPSADRAERHHADFSFTELAQAYFDCRQTKRNKPSAIAFEQHLERNLVNLFDELQAITTAPVWPTSCGGAGMR